jgi:hypothetical protein
MILLALLPTYQPVPRTTSALDPGQTLPRSVDAPPLDEVRTRATVEAKRPTIAITFQQL